jgi:hypothetical protein
MLYCPRCGTETEETAAACASCTLPLKEIFSIVHDGGKSRYWRRLTITILLFLLLPWVILKIGEKVNPDFYEFYAGILLVLLLPGLPWAVSAIFNRVKK